MALYHRLSKYVVACNVKIVKSEYSCTKVQINNIILIKI